MYSRIKTAVIRGIDSIPVTVEADVSNGLPVFQMVGFLSSEVREAKERVSTALHNVGCQMPVKHITVNISPAGIRKSGTGFDLAVAASIMAAIGLIPPQILDQVVMIGELALNGGVNPVSGILPMVITAREEKAAFCIVPYENYREASLVDGIQIVPVSNLSEVTDFLKDGVIPDPPSDDGSNREINENVRDFKYIRGQKEVRRACEVAVAGGHNLLLIGPPGSGKTMTASCIPTILPPMTEEEQLEVTRIYSVCGLLSETNGLIRERPFRAPHHTVSEAGLVGGGSFPKPGEISLAHEGVLFLDELPEFPRSVIEVLRQPLEEHAIHIVRQQAAYTFPADFMLVAAMNPCPCGYYPDRSRCHCTPSQVREYLNRISQPLLDRIDICVDAPKVGFAELIDSEEAEDSASIRARVIEAHEVQKRRFAGTNILFNSRIPAGELSKYCPLGESESAYLAKMYDRLGLTARSCHRLLRVARTVADLDHSMQIRRKHLTEAIFYRSLDRRYWQHA